MAMNPLPPQAYTKETMLKAYAWLQTQADSIKEMAHSPDILVSLYLKAKMNGEASLERPSIQNFKAELKNLAGMMGEFENGGESTTAKVTKAAAPMSAAPSATQPSSRFSTFTSQPEKSAPTATEFASNFSFEDGPSAASTSELDPQSQAIIREVKNQLNLSSDTEALRLIISVGFKKIRQLF
jgi:hypothetical protein